MPRLFFARFVSIVAFSVTVSWSWHFAFSQSWPQYRGPNGDGKIAAGSESVGWSFGPPKIIWKQQTALGFSSFAVSDGRAITLVARENPAGGASQTCVALHAETGEELWAHALSEHDYGRGGGNAGARGNRGGDGPRSTPTIDGNHVYVYDAAMLLACLKADSGELVWQIDVSKSFAGENITWSNAISPVIDGDRLLIAGGGVGQAMIALNKFTGEVIWKTGDEKMTHATPIVRDINGKKQVIFFMQSGLVALGVEDGGLQWSTPFDHRTSSAASPVTAGNLVYCSAGYGVGAGLFEIGAGGGQGMSVRELWRKPNRLMNHWSTPVVHDGYLYGLFSFKKYGKGPLQCVELATGDIKWQRKGFGPGNCILVGDKLIVLSDSGELVIVAAKSDAYQEIARAKVLEGKCWSTPAYVDGKVYIRSTKEGACVEIGQ